MKISKFFTLDEIKRIEHAVAEAEKATSGEILTMVVEASSDYRWVRWFWAGIGWLLASAAVCAIDLGTDWAFTVFEVLEFQLTGALAGLGLSFLPPLRQLALTRGQTAWRVHREALANFMASGLHETRHRTGILIYLSLLERRVQILADSGIHGKAGEPYWNEMVQEIVAGIREERACDALCRVIARIGQKLSEHFPPYAGETNEIINQVRLGPADDQN